MPKRKKTDLSQKSRKSRKQERFRLRSVETEEQRNLRLAKQRERRENETPEQRAERLSKQRHRMTCLRRNKYRLNKTSLKTGQEKNVKTEEIVKIENDSEQSGDNNSVKANEHHALQNSDNLPHIKEEWSPPDINC